MAVRRARGFAFLLLGVVALSIGVTARSTNAASGGAAPAAPRQVGSLPIVAEHCYRMAAKIRPFLLFWIGREDVGGARVVWRRGSDGAVGFELLIGSDPSRAPRRLNHWGYVAEEVHGSEARLLGVMKQSNEQSLEEAKSMLAREAQEGHVFKAIHGVATANEAGSKVTTIRLDRDFTFHEVDALLDLVEREPVNRDSRRVSLPSGTRPGFLVALAELIHGSVGAPARPAAGTAARGTRSLPYIYNGTLRDLTLRESAWLRETRVGTRSYRDVIRARFEARNRETGTATEFELLYGASGPLAEIPVHAVYQPRWWLQIELFLDDATDS